MARIPVARGDTSVNDMDGGVSETCVVARRAIVPTHISRQGWWARPRALSAATDDLWEDPRVDAAAPSQRYNPLIRPQVVVFTGVLT